ncbi:hypothetical protein BGX28_008236 [Mortierella sp. GBA30]|nr:hypothetical protein BGX28_008236 [Mortierella sp. GBA30]
MSSKPCKFCDIATGSTGDQIVYQDEEMVAFYDIRPAAQTHILIIPRKHIVSVQTVDMSDYQLLLKFKAKAHDLLRQHGHEPETSR